MQARGGEIVDHRPTLSQASAELARCASTFLVHEFDAATLLLRLPGFQKPDLTALRPEAVWDAYIRMRGVRVFYEGVRDRPFIAMPCPQQPRGDCEFEVLDPNGDRLVFSEL
jgi:hypothetical protein